MSGTAASGMDVGDIITNIIAGLALLLSGYAAITTTAFNRRQSKLIDSQERLNQKLLAQEEKDDVQARRADVSATIVKLGNNKERVKVYNKGKADAQNVRIEFPDGDDLVIRRDVQDKFPMPLLRPHQAVELIAAIHFGTSARHRIILRWEDEHTKDNEQEMYLTT
ncbi:MAG: hypothetical protein ACWA6X_07480 [Bauldia sp.]